MLAGYNDEAMSLVRNIAETSNLMWLFLHDSTQARRWTEMDSKERWKYYRPVKVREQIEKMGQIIPVSESDFSELSGGFVHIDPSRPPNAHNDNRLPILGAFVQEHGVKTVLAKLPEAFCLNAGPIARMADLDELHRELIIDQTVSLMRELAGFDEITTNDKQGDAGNGL
jgi:hypothetical protein